MVVNDTSIIFSMAASTSYTEPLDIALSNNTLSILRILDLAKLCPNIKSLVHASTIFILTYSTGQIDEEIINISDDSEQLLQSLLSMPKEEIRQ
jgi:hypothetical protein|mmetsp:Transcript_24547/g.4077  ORF Transcript_24547/g.4077 Transcript_24547/m.4077 type:complete len:94 (+) Transcript_24547:304-585(+)